MNRVCGCSTRPEPKLVPEPGRNSPRVGIPASCSASKELNAIAGESWRRLHHHGVAAHNGGHGHARHEGTREIPRRNHRATPSGMYCMVSRSPAIAPRSQTWSAQGLTRIEFGEINGPAMSASASAQFLPTSKIIQAENSNLRSRRMADTLSSRAARCSAEVRFQLSNAVAAAWTPHQRAHARA